MVNKWGSVPTCTYLFKKKKKKPDYYIVPGEDSWKDCKFPFLFAIREEIQCGMYDGLFF